MRDKGKFVTRGKETFIKACRETHGDIYDYSKVVYTNCKDKVEIVCKNHGSFFLTADNHQRRGGCPQCVKEKSLKVRTEKFIEDSKNIYGDKYDYSLVEYVNNRVPVIIECKEHGVFVQPPINFLGGTCCPKCREGVPRSDTSTTEEFIRKAKERHGNTYNYQYVEYENAKSKVIIECKIHGKFEQNPITHHRGSHCPKCATNNTGDKLRGNTEDFIKKAKKIHGDKYEYDEVEYKQYKQKVKIRCKYHGIFEQAPSVHLQNKGCRECSNLINIYNREDYIKLSKEALLYIVKLKKGDEEFFKIGKTKNSIKERLNNNIEGYDYEIIAKYRNESGYIFDMEIKIHKKYFEYGYKPTTRFAGHTECYRLDLPIDEIEDMIIQG